MISPVLLSAPADLLDADTIWRALGLRDIGAVDDLLLNRGRAAVAYFDGFRGILRRAILTQTWRVDADCWQRMSWELLDPIQSITSVQYWDRDGVQQTLDDDYYRYSGNSLFWSAGFVGPSIYSRSDAVSVTFVAGVDEAKDVPPVIFEACVLKLKALHANAQRDPTVQSETVYGVSSQTFGPSMAAEYEAAIMRLVAPFFPMMV